MTLAIDSPVRSSTPSASESRDEPQEVSVDVSDQNEDAGSSHSASALDPGIVGNELGDDSSFIDPQNKTESYILPENPKDAVYPKMNIDSITSSEFRERYSWFVVSTLVVFLALIICFLSFVVKPWISLSTNPSVGPEGYKLESYSMWTAGLSKAGTTSYFPVSPSCTVQACSPDRPSGTCPSSTILLLESECAAYNTTRFLSILSLILISMDAALLLFGLLKHRSFSQGMGRRIFKLSAFSMLSAGIFSLISFSVFLNRLYYAHNISSTASVDPGIAPFILTWIVSLGAAAAAGTAFFFQKRYHAAVFHGKAPPPDRTCPEIGFV